MDILNDYPLLLCIAIFLARVVDVSMGTLRTILVFKSYRVLAAMIGFFEVLIWLVAAGKVIQNLDSWYLAVSYAGGFAIGNIVGIWLESKLAMGSELIRAVSENPEIRLASRLREQDFSVVEITGHGENAAPVEILLVVEQRRKLPRLLQLINHVDPDAVYTTSDIKHHHGRGISMTRKKFSLKSWLFRAKRK